MKTDLEVLKAARDLISDEKRWTKFTFGKNESGDFLDESDITKAVCFCGSGAILYCGGTLYGLAYRTLAKSMESECICDFNDSHTHAEVLAKFDEALASMEAE